MKVVDSQGNVIDLNEQADPNQLIGGLLSGNIMADANSTYKIKAPSGKIFDVPAADLGNVLEAGGSFYGVQEQAKEAEAQRFEGLPQQAAAAGLGAARGLSLGLSDVALTKAGLLSPEYLQKQEEYNPELGLAGEIAGTVLPTFLSGGTSLTAQVAAKTPAALAGRAGLIASEAIAPLAKAAGKLSPIASKAVETAIKTGAGSAVESAFFSGGKVLSEDAINDKPFAAESLLTGMGTGALIGGLTGGALGAGTEAIAEGAKKAISKVSELAAKENLTPAFIARSFGTSQGNLREILGNEFKMESIEKVYRAMKSDMNLVPEQVSAEIGGNAKRFNQLFDEASQAPVKLSKITDNLETSMQQIENIKTHAANAIDNALESVQSLTDTKDIIKSMDAARSAVGDFDFATQDRVKSYLDRLKQTLADVDPDTGKLIYKDLSAKELWQARRSIDDVINNSKDITIKGWADNPFTQALSEGRKKIESRIEEMIETTNPAILKDYKAAKQAYAGASDLGKLANAQEAKNANNIFSLTDMLAGGAGASIAGIPGAIAGAAARKITREYGDKAVVSILTQLEKNSGKMTNVIDDSIKGLFKAERAAVNILSVKGVESQQKEKTYEEKLKTYTDNANSIENVTDRLEKALVNLGAAAPETALALRDKTLNAMDFLASKLPKKPNDSVMVKYQIPESELDKFNRYSTAVNNPTSIIKNLKNGYISPEEVEVLKKVYPEIHKKLTTSAIDQLAKRNKDINYQLRIQLQKLLDNKQEVNMYPRGIVQLQSSFGVQPQEQELMQATAPVQKLPGARAKNMNLSGSTDTGLQATLKRRNT